MSRRALLAAGLVAWLVALGITLQPHHAPPPPIQHAHRLDPADTDLPTLPPAGR